MARASPPGTLPGASAQRRLLVNGTTTTVAIVLRLKGLEQTVIGDSRAVDVRRSG